MGGRQQRGAALLMVMVVLAMLAAGMAWLVEDGRRRGMWMQVPCVRRWGRWMTKRSNG
jgi:type II secretory pathway component PulK